MAYNPQNPNGQATSANSSPVVFASDQINGIKLVTLSTWASGTTSGTTQTIYNNSGASAAIVQLDQGAGISAGAITFQVSYDGTNYVVPPANAILDPTSANYAQIPIPYNLAPSTNKPFIIDSNGWQALQIKVSTTTAGGSVTPYYALLDFDPVDSAIVYSPTAANFNATVTGTVTASPPVTGTITTGQKSSIGTSALQMDSSSVTLTQGVIIEALSSNTASVYVGNSSGVTTSTGIELPPGASVTLPLNNLNIPYVISTATGQTVTYVGA